METSFWQGILDAKGAVPAGHDLHALTAELLGALGSSDPYLRDVIAYPLLAQWVSESRYSLDDLRAMIASKPSSLASRRPSPQRLMFACCITPDNSCAASILLSSPASSQRTSRLNSSPNS